MTMNKYSFGWSAVFVWIPMIFFLVVSAIGLLVETKTKRMLGFYALMLGGLLVGAFVGGAVGLWEELAGFCMGIVAGAFGGLILGATSCGFLSDDDHTVPVLIFIFGAVTSALIGILAGGLAGAQNYSALAKYCLLLLTAEFISFCLAHVVKFAMGLKGTLHMILNWRDW